VVTANVESALFRRHVKRHQGDWNVDVEEHAALQTMHVVVPLDPTVVPARLIRERQFLDQSVLGEQVQRAVDRAVGDARVTAPDALEDLARRQVALRPAHLFEDFRSLRCISENSP
jgi:hypothetical protein